MNIIIEVPFISSTSLQVLYKKNQASMSNIDQKEHIISTKN